MLSPKRGRDLGAFGSAEAMDTNHVLAPSAGLGLDSRGGCTYANWTGEDARLSTCYCRVVDWGGSSRAPMW